MLAEISLGEWLKRRRKAGGWTQQELALQISCSTSALKKFEAEARRPSAQIVERLAEIFKIPPNEQTSFLRFARGDWRDAWVEVMGEAPWRASTASPRSNLPVPPTGLIGREHEIADLREYISDPGTRLITLIGPPGIGKTRLGVAVAHESLSEFADGVFFVALAPLQDPNILAPTIVQILGIAKSRHSLPIHSIMEGIGEKKFCCCSITWSILLKGLLCSYAN